MQEAGALDGEGCVDHARHNVAIDEVKHAHDRVDLRGESGDRSRVEEG